MKCHPEGVRPCVGQSVKDLRLETAAESIKKLKILRWTQNDIFRRAEITKEKNSLSVKFSNNDMHSFDVVSDPAEPRVNARGTTRAGLLVAAIKGMRAVAHPTFFEKEGERERTFSIKADDFTGLLNELMKISIALSKEKQEAYTDVRFDLITDKEAKGALIGKPVVKADVTINTASSDGSTIGKNAEGIWEATIAFNA